MFKYQKTKRYFAQVSGGLEGAAAAELEALGAGQIRPGFRGIHFSADQATLYGIHYQARLVTRVLAPLFSFVCRDRDDLYRQSRSVDWAALFSPGQTFAVSSHISGNSQITHSNFASLCLKDAIADFFTARFGRRPDVDKREPDLWLNLHLEKEKATVSLDTSGGSLHRRGYRRETVEAPMQETLAAAMVALSGWDGTRPLYDPMCGSGTLLCEAVMTACRIPAGFLRKDFGFRLLPDFDEALWDRVKQEADAKIVGLPRGLVRGSDIDPQAVRAAKTNSRLLPDGRMVGISQKDFRHIPALEEMVILCNPPYGIRLGHDGGIDGFYKALGDFLKQRCRGSEATIYFGKREMLKKIGLRPAWRRPVRNAGLDGRLAKFELY